jgi:hypothetical protein
MYLAGEQSEWRLVVHCGRVRPVVCRHCTANQEAEETRPARVSRKMLMVTGDDVLATDHLSTVATFPIF